VEVLHEIGDILTKISVNCVINLHDALLFTCLILWVYLMCGYICLYIYGYCLNMLHGYVYSYFSMNLCLYNMYLSIYVLYEKFRKSFVCICFNCMQFEKFTCHISVGCWVCYNMFCKRMKSVILCIMPRHGWSGMLHYIWSNVN
jgi:hypothetical protein